jgi:hypothetical protein
MPRYCLNGKFPGDCVQVLRYNRNRGMPQRRGHACMPKRASEFFKGFPMKTLTMPAATGTQNGNFEDISLLNEQLHEFLIGAGTSTLPKMMGNVPIWPLTSISHNHPNPLAPALPPFGGGGACDSSVLPEIPIQVIQHYRNRGAIAAGRSPWSVSVFPVQSGCTFSHYILGMQFLPFFTP